MKRYTQAEKRTILDELAASGQSRAAFCRERGLCYASVGAWAKALDGPNPPTGFIEVACREEPARHGIEVWLSSSICVRFSADTAAARLADFCREVSKC